MLSVAQIGRDHLILHWKTEEGVADAGSAHLLLHWRKEGGDWQERPVDRSATTARLDVRNATFWNTGTFSFKPPPQKKKQEESTSRKRLWLAPFFEYISETFWKRKSQ